MPDPTASAQAEGLFAAALDAQGLGRFEEAVRLLGQACDAGHVGAMSLLGAQLLFGRGAPPDPERGLTLVRRAADLGGGSACALAATLSASGVLGPADWGRALDDLQRGAEAGNASAQGQLALLADPSGQPARASWAELRRGVDLTAWRSPPPLRVLSADPQIRAAEDFVSPAVCGWIVGRAKDRLQPATVSSNQGEGEVRAQIRTNSHAGFDLMAADLILLIVRERMAAGCGLDVRAMEAAQALHYAPGEEYRPHFDFLRPELDAHAATLAALGQRTHTVLVYLNDDYEGGETEFPQLQIKHRGHTGGLLTFRNVDASGRPDRRMLHAGLAPTSGEKWLLSQWVRDRPQPT